MNLSIKKRTLKTADGVVIKKPSKLFHLQNSMNGGKITEVRFTHWYSGGKIIWSHYYTASPITIDMRGYPKGIFRIKDNPYKNPYMIIPWYELYASREKAVTAYKARLKKMAKVKL